MWGGNAVKKGDAYNMKKLDMSLSAQVDRIYRSYRMGGYPHRLSLKLAAINGELIHAENTAGALEVYKNDERSYCLYCSFMRQKAENEMEMLCENYLERKRKYGKAENI